MYFKILLILVVFVELNTYVSEADDVLGCGGFVKSNFDIDFEFIKVKLFTKQGIFKYESGCAPSNGYYMVPVYDKGEYYLKVESLLGWNFDPDIVELNVDWETDKCSLEEDINFVFSGFRISGKVISFGQEIGPEGVSLSLKNREKGGEMANTMTTKGGDFSFEKIFPGHYIITANHPNLKFTQNESLVTVDTVTGKIETDIIVAGFIATGKILSDGQPVQGVYFLLYSNSVDQINVKECDTKIIQTAPIVDNSKFLCSVLSSNAGKFIFPVLPSGEYMLIPLYQNEKLKYEVTPNNFTFIIEQESYFLQEPFQVSGFLVSGKILASLTSKGLKGATIYLNDNPISVSDATGTYLLDGMKAGMYKVKIELEGYFFKQLKVNINPGEPLLPDIYPLKYKVCGKIILDKLPENTLKNFDFVVKFQTLDGNIISKISPKSDYSFCEYLSANEYIIKVENENLSSRIYLLPSARQIEIIDHPINEVIFTQMQAQISGTIKCIDKCENIQLFVKYTDEINDEEKTINLYSKEKFINFVQDVFIGNYIISILNKNWCWENENLKIQIKNEGKSHITFEQTGYQMNAVLSHDAFLTINNGKDVVLADYKALKGNNVICLPSNNVFQIIPNSCHQFEKDIYTYDANVGLNVIMNVVSYMIKIEVSTDEKDVHITAIIKDNINLIEINLNSSNFILMNEEDKNVTQYLFEASFFARKNINLLIVLHSKTLLFEPESKEIQVTTDNCPAILTSFKGVKGIFVSGEVEPPIPQVKINLQFLNSDKFLNTQTDTDGKYIIGPLKNNIGYNLSTSKLGYRFSENSKKEKSTDCDSALIPLLCVHG